MAHVFKVVVSDIWTLNLSLGFLQMIEPTDSYLETVSRNHQLPGSTRCVWLLDGPQLG